MKVEITPGFKFGLMLVASGMGFFGYNLLQSNVPILIYSKSYQQDQFKAQRLRISRVEGGITNGNDYIYIIDGNTRNGKSELTIFENSYNLPVDSIIEAWSSPKLSQSFPKGKEEQEFNALKFVGKWFFLGCFFTTCFLTFWILFIYKKLRLY